MKRRRRIVIGALVLLAAASGIWLERELLAKIWTRTLPEGGLLELRVRRAEPDRLEWIGGEGPRLAAEIYEPRAGGPGRAAVLLLHGNRAAGSRAPLYRLLSRAMADAGCFVLALNLRGFGGSEPAPAGRAVTALDLQLDVERGATALGLRAPAGIPRAVVGHSLGANLALRFAPREGWRAVAVEPGLHVRQRAVEPPAPALDEYTRKLRGTLRGGIVDRESVRLLYRDLDPQAPGDPVAPEFLLVLQGWQVPAEDRDSIRATAAARTGTALHFLDSRDHDFGTVEAGGWIFHPRGLTRALVDTTVAFVISGSAPAGLSSKS